MQYVAKYGKSYDTIEEFEFRKGLYMKIDSFIKAHNESGASYLVGHNKFSDYTQSEK